MRVSGFTKDARNLDIIGMVRVARSHSFSEYTLYLFNYNEQKHIESL